MSDIISYLSLGKLFSFASAPLLGTEIVLVSSVGTHIVATATAMLSASKAIAAKHGGAIVAVATVVAIIVADAAVPRVEAVVAVCVAVVIASDMAHVAALRRAGAATEVLGATRVAV